MNELLPTLLWTVSLVALPVCLWTLARIRPLWRWLAAAPLACALCLPPGTALLRTLLAHPPGRLSGPPEAIVVLGRGGNNTRRAAIATALWQEHPAVQIVLSGTWDSLRMAEALQAAARVPPARIIVEADSMTTRENAVFTHRKLAPLGVRRILLVSDPEHMLRATLAFRGVGFEVEPVGEPAVSLLCTRCYVSPFDPILTHEYIGLVAYGLRGWF